MRDVETQSRPSGREQEPPVGLRRLVVALDGTPFAETALPTAVALARSFNAEVVLVRAHVARDQPVRTGLGLRRQERETLARASLYLARTEQALRVEGVRAVGILPVGRAAEAVADVASQEGDLVLVATHASARAVRSAQVSVARELAMRVAAPLLLVSPMARSLFTQATRTPTMVVALEGDRCDTLPLRLVTSLARSFGGHVIAVGTTHGADRKQGESGSMGPVVQKHQGVGVTDYLETVRYDLARCGVAAWTALVDGNPTAEIAWLARTEADLVVLGIHGTLAQREATAERAMAVLHSTGAAVLLVPQGPLLSLMPGGLPTKLARGDAR